MICRNWSCAETRLRAGVLGLVDMVRVDSVVLNQRGLLSKGLRGL